MPRKSNIKWRSGDQQKLENEIKKFNAKIYRTRVNHPELKDVLPKTILKEDKQQIIESLKNNPRSEFNKTINSLDRFLKKGAEKPITSKTGNTITKWEKKEVGLKVAQLNRERTKERKKIEAMDVTSQGQPVGLKRGEMGSERMNALKPKKFNFDKIRGGKEWEKFKASINKQTSSTARNELMEQYKQNYLTSLDTAYGGYADDVRKIIEELPADVVNETYYKEQEATITFNYEKQEMEFKLDVIRNIWTGVKNNLDTLNG